MPSVWVVPPKKRGGNYLVLWEKWINGKRISGSKSCGPFRDLADQFKSKKLKELYSDELGISQEKPKIFWLDFAKQYLEHCKKHKAPRTYRNFDQMAVGKFSTFIGNKEIQSIGSADISAFEDALHKGGFSPNTIRIVLRTVRVAFNYAKKQGYLPGIPAFHFPPANPVGKALSNEEVAKLLAHCSPSVAQCVKFLLHTGLRRGELISLSWDKIRANSAEIGGFGSFQTKTRDSRIVPLDPEAIKAMGSPGKGQIFPVTVNILTHGIANAARKAGIGRVRVHDLRHTWATRFMETANSDIFSLMAIGGWKDLRTVRIYQHIRHGRITGIHVNYQ